MVVDMSQTSGCSSVNCINVSVLNTTFKTYMKLRTTRKTGPARPDSLDARIGKHAFLSPVLPSCLPVDQRHSRATSCRDRFKGMVWPPLFKAMVYNLPAERDPPNQTRQNEKCGPGL
ncbi:hypothetical protein PR048_005714 [Dryococelus australis]|uniref:Uncharacterized protein n=1 Tax=Dryococelus australis TaxID=614101 RepID=A0ABQ9I948_9NEOP|nr:hypothetical protein PR048_005714 [Dryococelus australis]